MGYRPCSSACASSCTCGQQAFPITLVSGNFWRNALVNEASNPIKLLKSSPVSAIVRCLCFTM